VTCRAWPVLLLACAGAAAQAQQGFEQEFEDESKPWREVQAQLPAYPKNENLFQLQGPAAVPYRYFIDTISIAVGADGVVRYSLIVRTPGGAENVSFEGIRCETRERRLYAFGRPDGSWSRARGSRWERIEGNIRQAQHHMMLYHDFFCPDGRIVRDKDEIMRGLRLGLNPRIDELQRSWGGD